jgi:hypothetical protein
VNGFLTQFEEREMSTGTIKRTIVTAATFVKVYMMATTMDEMEKELGLARGNIQYRANSLRKRGVNLPKKFVGDRKTNKLDIDALNALIVEATTPAAPAKKGKAK